MTKPSLPPRRRLTLGGFTLGRRLGRGGMAEVWMGRHAVSGITAALKVVRPSFNDTADFAEGFAREVRAVASLNHPGIVGVYDAGRVDAASAAQSRGLLAEGFPWLAMEYADGGDLSRWPRPLAWPALYTTVLQILDALAHAHARGVIHRDLKPANILVKSGPQRQLMLTDFGIAHLHEPALDSDAVGSTNSGTPHYMAPEQIRGEWRDYGPWTDLYALGCVAFELACGRPPYEGSSPMAIAMQQMGAPVPHLEAGPSVPDAFGEWVRRLMAKQPSARFETAADAAWHLARIPTPFADPTVSRPWPSLSSMTERRPATETAVMGTLSVVLDTAFLDQIAPMPTEVQSTPPALQAAIPTPPIGVPRIDQETPPESHESPPMPGHWRGPGLERPMLQGLGLGLFGLRETPFIGREGERDRLWQALAATHRSGRSRLVLIDGPRGAGKTRLMEWLCRRSEELGVATTVRVEHGPVPTPMDGVPAAMRSWFRGDDLSPAALEERIGQRLRRMMPYRDQGALREAAEELARLLTENQTAEATSTAAERTALIAYYLRQATSRRPLVLAIDNAHFGPGALALIQYLLDDRRQTPMLILATLRSDLLSGLPAEGALDALLEHAESERLWVGPLPDDEHARFVGELLGLAPSLAERLRVATDGAPFFAHQVVADWVERGALAPSDDGYRLADGQSAEVPAELLQLEARRLERFVDRFDRPQRARRALEAAATLGHAVDRGEWKRVCAVLGCPPPADLVQVLADRGWARLVPSGWCFAHDVWRDALLSVARDAGRLASVHRACARVIEATAPSALGASRVARHRFEAGDWAGAQSALERGARLSSAASDYRAVLRFAERYAEIADLVERDADAAEPDELGRGRMIAMRADALRYLGRLEEGMRSLAPLAHSAHPVLRAEFNRISAGLAHMKGDVKLAGQRYAIAARLYTTAGDVLGEVRSRHGWGWVELTRLAFDESRAVFAHAARLAEAHGLPIEAAWCLHGIASTYVYAGLPDGFEPARRAHALFEAGGSRAGMAATLHFMAETLGFAGRTEQAMAYFDQAVETWQAIGSTFPLLGRTGQALMLLDAGRDDDAEALLDALPPTHTWQLTTPQFKALYLVACALLAARRGDAAECRRRLGMVEVAVAPRLRGNLAEIADRLERLGERDAAARAWEFAARSWQPIDPERAAECERRQLALALNLDAPPESAE